MEQTISGVGVLDKSVAVVEAVAAAERPCALGDLVEATSLPKATAHRLASALEAHGLLRRDGAGRYLLGLRLVGLGRSAADHWPLAERARPALEELRRRTGESAQLYVRDGVERICVVSLESAHELRTIVPEGVRLPLGVGSAGRLLGGEVGDGGWLASVEERAPGVASVSAPVRDPDGVVVAAVGISGPVGRLGSHLGDRYGAAVVEVAATIEETLAR